MLNETCNRCERYVGIGIGRTTLAGNFLAELCVKCTNDWTRYCDGLKEWRELVDMKIEYDHMMGLVYGDGANRLEDLKVIDRKYVEAKVRLFEVAEKFVVDGPVSKKKENQNVETRS